MIYFYWLGRYLINSSFNYNDYNNNNNIFKLNLKIKDRKYFYTCFYKISKTLIDNYINIIDSLINEIITSNKYDYQDYEVFFPPKLDNINIINNLGITQNIAVWNEVIDI